MRFAFACDATKKRGELARMDAAQDVAVLNVNELHGFLFREGIKVCRKR